MFWQRKVVPYYFRYRHEQIAVLVKHWLLSLPLEQKPVMTLIDNRRTQRQIYEVQITMKRYLHAIGCSRLSLISFEYEHN